MEQRKDNDVANDDVLAVPDVGPGKFESELRPNIGEKVDKDEAVGHGQMLLVKAGEVSEKASVKAAEHRDERDERHLVRDEHNDLVEAAADKRDHDDVKVEDDKH